MINLKKIGWENYPSTKTPRNAENFNKMEENTQEALTELENIILGNLLYENENGTTGDVTISQSAEEFDYIEIFYKNGDNFYNSTKIASPNGKFVNLAIVFVNQLGLVFNIASAIIQINNTTISKKYWGNSTVGSSTTNVSTTDMIKITKIIGYKGGKP